MHGNHQVQITLLPQKEVRDCSAGITGFDIIKLLKEKPQEETLAMVVNDVVWDLGRSIEQDAQVKLISWADPLGKKVFWHSSAHLLGAALESMYPDIHLGIGPSTEHGFYYDVDFGEHPFDASQLPSLEKKMLELAQYNSVYTRELIPKDQALAHYKRTGNHYKLELIADLTDGDITFYHQGSFTDLCRGPHLPHTGYIKALKLRSVAGAYWRGDSSRKQLTRIYGISFPTQELLEAYLQHLQEAKARDHRLLGKALKLYTFSDKVGKGLVLWLPKGAIVRSKLIAFLQNIQDEAGYMPVVTPHIGCKQLYTTSGHYDKYAQDTFKPMTSPASEEIFLLRPMNCPHHCEIYSSSPRSYKELPLQLAEFGTVYRFEQHGELHGLTRLRGFTQDDGHIFCRPDQIKGAFKNVLSMMLRVLKQVGLDKYAVQLSLSDQDNFEKYIGNRDVWLTAEGAIMEAAEESQLTTTVVRGEAAFYGPKLDLMVKDALGRSWQLGTIQLDYQLPQRFDLTYIGPDNQEHRPVMIHRALVGSLERLIALLLEHTAGRLPVWLSAVQVALLPISVKHTAYVQHVARVLQEAGIRIEVDNRNEKIGRKIRDASMQKVPYILILGEKEQCNNQVTVREIGKSTCTTVKLEDFIATMLTAIEPW